MRREHGQQFGVAGHKWTGSVGGSKHDRVARGSENYPAPEMTFQTFWIGAWSNQFEPKRGQARSGTVARDGQYPGETNIGEDLGLNIIGQQPAELNAALVFIGFIMDFFRAGKLFIARRLAHGFTQVCSRQSGKRDGIKVFWLGLRTQL